MDELDKLEKYLKNQDLFNSLEALRGLRAKCARLEREAEWLALVLANACCGVPLSEYIDMDINCMSPPAPEHWRDTARKSVEVVPCPKN